MKRLGGSSTLDTTSSYPFNGTSDGRILLYSYPSGHLLRTISAHFRSLTALRWTAAGEAFGKEEGPKKKKGKVRVLKNDMPEPWNEVNAHRLPVTDLKVGKGAFPRSKMWSCSTDGEVKRHPINHILIDPLERFFVAIGEEKGEEGKGGWVRRVEISPSPSTGRLDDLQDGTKTNVFRTRTKVSSAEICMSMPYILITTMPQEKEKSPATLHVFHYSMQPVRTQSFVDCSDNVRVLSVLETPMELISREPPLREMGRVISSTSSTEGNILLIGGLEPCVDVEAELFPWGNPEKLGSGTGEKDRTGKEREELERLRLENERLRDQARRATRLADEVWKLGVEDALHR
ncbi:hypothetical protein BT69DRAFT_1298944 [Atractiella rhizophila]|nr:hypothetical protein BT69DRAFT_1298944 [Atractiella rhizophila]